jgi:hypothetical protein
MKGVGPSQAHYIVHQATRISRAFSDLHTSNSTTDSHEASDIRFQPFHRSGFPIPGEFDALSGRENGAVHNLNPNA